MPASHTPARTSRPHAYRSPHREPITYQPPVNAATTAVLPPIVTLLTPEERHRVHAATLGRFHPVHRDDLEQCVHELRDASCAALIVSIARLSSCPRGTVARLAELVRIFPRVPTIALLTDPTPGILPLLLALGRAGVRCLVDTRHADGWHTLTGALSDDPLHLVGREALARIEPELAGAREGMLRFFRALFDVPPEPVTVRTLADQLGALPTTLMSRFARAGLPSPKRYLALARLVRAARLLESPGSTLAAVTDRLEYSSPQSFNRHVQLLLHVTAAEFRRGFDAERMLALFCEELVTPYRHRLRACNPLGRL
jgi:AraC-like DNA-binding protein